MKIKVSTYCLAVFVIAYIAIVIVRAFNGLDVFYLSALSIICLICLLLFFVDMGVRKKGEKRSLKFRNPGVLQVLVFIMMIYNSYKFLLPGNFAAYWVYYLSMLIVYLLLTFLVFTNFYHTERQR
ncbi:hypothetical protein [Chitinophaga sancti]|uniref:hypothetical protein n=1 Tax=Chitinophaga sancti TaxID=1004 RepID=UPI003F78C3B5